MNSTNNYKITLINNEIYCSSIIKDKETIYLKMELLTPENSKAWTQFKGMSVWIANDTNGVLSSLVSLAGKDSCPAYEEIKEYIEFTKEEYVTFINKAIAVKNTNNKITEVLKKNSAGTNHMNTYFYSDKKTFIVYATTNPNFSILNKSDRYSLKNYIESYKDILISVGSDFSYSLECFENRGISRNPYWVFEEKYAGLSMLLHGFSGAVAHKYYPHKTIMRVNPLGSMQFIINKNILPGEGFIEINDQKLDLTKYSVKKTDPEGKMNNIKVEALKRIFEKSVNSS